MREKKKDKTAWKCQVQKGSMTVEAAFVMPLVLLVVFALLLLTMFRPQQGLVYGGLRGGSHLCFPQRVFVPGRKLRRWQQKKCPGKRGSKDFPWEVFL